MSRTFPIIRSLEWLGANRVRLFFATGKISEVTLPIRSARNAHVVFGGVGLDPGDGRELSAATVHAMPGKVWRAPYGEKTHQGCKRTS